MLNRQTIELGFILKQIPDFDFSMDGFQNRLKLQKSLYLLQSFGIYLGYDFSWYLRGPYCSILSSNGFELQEHYNDIPNDKIKFKKSETQKRFMDFLKFVKGKDVDSLEIAASLHYLKQVCTLSEDKIKDKVVKKQERFTKPQVEKIWNEIIKWCLI